MEEKILKAIDGLSKRFDSLEGRFDSLEGKVDSLQVQVRENTDILKALEHSAQVNKTEHDRMNNDIVHLQGDVASIKKDLSKVEIITSSNWSDIALLKAAK